MVCRRRFFDPQQLLLLQVQQTANICQLVCLKWHSVVRFAEYCCHWPVGLWMTTCKIAENLKCFGSTSWDFTPIDRDAMTDTGDEVRGSLNFKAMFFAALVRAAGWSHRKHMLGQMEQLKKKAGKCLGKTLDGADLWAFNRFIFKKSFPARWQRKMKRWEPCKSASGVWKQRQAKIAETMDLARTERHVTR